MYFLVNAALMEMAMTRIKFDGKNFAEVQAILGADSKLMNDEDSVYVEVSTPLGVRKLRPGDSLVSGDISFWVEKGVKHEPLRRLSKPDTTVRCSTSSSKGRAFW